MMVTKEVHGVRIRFMAVLVLRLTTISSATDEQSLLAFKQNLRDPTGVLSNWNNSSVNSLPFCSWTGVACNNQTRVVNLTLSSYQLAGSISPTIGGLTFLQFLELSNNSLSGSVPLEIGNCSNLLSVTLSDNLLTGEVPLTVGNLKVLQVLHLARNRLNSTIPPALGNCSELTDLDLSYNNLVGSIPSSLGNCTNLSSLTLTGNKLTGHIPSSFGNLPLLQGLLLSSNSLTGGFPIELFESAGSQLNQRLTEVVLSENRLSGSLPDKFAHFQVLSTLDLSSNNFSGDVPTTLGQSPGLLSLNLAHNQFTGALPSSIGSLQRTFQISFNLSHNLMNGPIDVMGNLSTTVSIDLSSNNFSGWIGSLQYCLYLRDLNLADNFFSGEIGGLLGLGLVSLNVSNNNLTGSVDEFKNFTSASFLPGNDGLCGIILNRSCPEAPTPGPAPTVPEGNQTGLHRLSKTVVYTVIVVMGFGIIVIFASWLDGARVQSTRHLNDAVTCYGRGFQIIRVTVKDLLTATDGFHERHVIGHGGTSTVYKGLLPFYPFIIAVKKFHDNEEGRQRLLKEAGVMNIVRHRNIVGTLGIASVPRSVNALVLEYIANGTLNQHLHGREVCDLSWEVRLSIAIDVATAVSYLHEDSDHHLAVIHGDLKPANVFLDSDYSAKVGDFGLAKLLVDVDCEQRDDRRWEGTFGYSPPEHGEGLISTAGDVYSFGIIILEMATRRRPASLAFEELGGSFIYWVRASFPDRLTDIIDPTLKPAEDFSSKKDAIDLFFRVGLLCTRDNPRERPTMKEALEMLKTLAINSAANSAESAGSGGPVCSMEELINDAPYTSFQHAKTWGWVNKDYIVNSVDSALHYDSWLSLFQLDMRDSRTLKAMGLDAVAIVNIRKQCEERRAMRDRAAKTSWIRRVWRALFHRERFGRIGAE
ncbi:unnamed protein product [Calypogeia fissa]